MLTSIIIPFRDREDLTIRAIKSVLAQTNNNFELIVINDGSKEIDLTKYFSDKRIKFIYQENKGVSAARNLGIKNSKAELIAFLDSDDEWLPEKLEKQVNYFTKDLNCKILHTNEKWIRNGKFVNPKLKHKKAQGECFEKCLELCCISPSSVMIKKELLKEFNYFDEDMRVCEDYDLWLKISSKYRIDYLEEKLVIKYGGHSDQLSKSENAIDRFRVYALMKLLANNKLKLNQRTLVINKLTEKSNLISNGASKRSLHKRAQLYSKVKLLFKDSTIKSDNSLSPLSFKWQQLSE